MQPIFYICILLRSVNLNLNHIFFYRFGIMIECFFQFICDVLRQSYVSLRVDVCGSYGQKPETERFSKRAPKAGPSTAPCVESYFTDNSTTGWWWMIEGGQRCE